MKKFILLIMMSIAAGTAVAQTLEVCASKGYTLTSTAANPPFGATTYQWVEISSAGTSEVGTNQDTYSVEAGTKAPGTYQYVRMASNEDCPTGVASNTFTVRVLPSPDPPVMGGDGNSYCGSGTITATAGDGGTGIRWDDGSTLTLRTVNAAGTYYAVTTSAAGCTSSTATISVTITLPGAAGNAATCGCIQGLNDCDGTCLASCCTNCANWTTCPGFSFVSSVSYENETLMSRMDAEAYCQSKGAKLPNSTMMNCMCENKETLPGGYEADLYWINGGYDSGWWRAYNMNTCGSVLQQPTSLYHVKCVGDGVW